MTVLLPPTKTYRNREADYTPARPGLGVLEVREWNTPAKTRVSRFAVIEEPGEDGCRTFRLVKPGGAETYYCSIDPHRRTAVEDRCDCPAGCGHLWCKHQQALRAVVDAGHLPRVRREELT